MRLAALGRIAPGTGGGRASARRGRPTAICLLAVLFAVLAGRQPANADPEPIATRIDAALQNVATRVRPGQVGYATVWEGDKYVQCGHRPSGGWRCEAAGVRMQPSLAQVLTPERQAAMAALGWRLDPAFGNFVRFFDAAAPRPSRSPGRCA